MNGEPRYYCPEHLEPVRYLTEAEEYVCDRCGVLKLEELIDESEMFKKAIGEEEGE